MRREELLDLNDVLQHPGRKISVDISTEFPEDPDIVLARPLEGFVEAVSTGNLLLIKGKCKAGVIVDCARCGEPIEQEVEFEIEEQFPVAGVPSSYSHSDFAHVEADEPYPMFEGNSLNVQILLREDLIVGLPVQPLCQYGWEGNCPVAAARRAQEKGKPTSVRLSALEKFKTPESKETE